MGNGIDIQTTETRRRVLRRIVMRNPGCTVRDVLREANAIHAKGNWPQAKWAGARNEPYYGGISQMLDQLWYCDRESSNQNIRVTMLYTADSEGKYAKRYFSFRDVKKVLHTLLPQDDERKECEALIRRFQHEAGMDMVLGVEPDGKRLVRIGTRRGVVDWELRNFANGWVAAIKVAASEVGCNL